MKLTIKKRAVKKFLKGYPLIQEEDLVQMKKTTEWVELIDQQGKFLGKGYLGKQRDWLGTQSKG